ncbi:hypothetical protein [Pseudomonas phage D6]|nr:hypothetical protein [Pseudomonas phage D6]
MKLASLALSAVLAFSFVAQAEEIKHPDINPDVLHEIFMSSTLVQCDASACWDAVTKAEHDKVLDGAGWTVVFDDAVLTKLNLTVAQFNDYKPYVQSLMVDVAADLGAPVVRDI